MGGRSITSFKLNGNVQNGAEKTTSHDSLTFNFDDGKVLTISNKTGITSEDFADFYSVTSKEKAATAQIRQNVLTSASLQNESQSSYQVGLNMHHELSGKYN